MFNDFRFLYIGCGGTFWAASPLLSILNRRYQPNRSIFIDPDIIEEENANRQWSHAEPGDCKAHIGGEIVCGNASFGHMKTRFDRTEHDPGGPVVVIVNVDNNAARLEVREWLQNRPDLGIMIVTGCRGAFGQCYYGVYQNFGTIHDWLVLHPDVAELSEPDANRNPCGGQTIISNAITGQLIGLALQEVYSKLPSMDFDRVSGWYWKLTKQDDGREDLSITTQSYKGTNYEPVAR